VLTLLEKKKFVQNNENLARTSEKFVTCELGKYNSSMTSMKKEKKKA